VLDVARDLARRRTLLLDRAAIAVVTSLISLIVLPMLRIADTAEVVTVCMLPICWRISSVAFAVWLARLFTSEATTAKPRPASPARAASMVAFSARRLVCEAMVWIRSTTTLIRPAFSASPAWWRRWRRLPRRLAGDFRRGDDLTADFFNRGRQLLGARPTRSAR